MKKALTLIFICVAAVQLNAQSLKIGDVGARGLSITNESALRSFFLDNLDDAGQLGKIEVNAAPEGDRFMVYTSVTNNHKGIRAIGVMLVKKGSEAVIVSNQGGETNPVGPGLGGSITVTCTGVPCSYCVPEITWINKWIPLVKCKCKDSGAGNCNVTISMTFNVSAGF